LIQALKGDVFENKPVFYAKFAIFLRLTA